MDGDLGKTSDEQGLLSGVWKKCKNKMKKYFMTYLNIAVHYDYPCARTRLSQVNSIWKKYYIEVKLGIVKILLEVVSYFTLFYDQVPVYLLK